MGTYLNSCSGVAVALEQGVLHPAASATGFAGFGADVRPDSPEWFMHSPLKFTKQFITTQLGSRAHSPG